MRGVVAPRIIIVLLAVRCAALLCGVREADYSVDYGDVPAGALYWLRNRTKGVEERVFTVEDGQARFW